MKVEGPTGTPQRSISITVAKKFSPSPLQVSYNHVIYNRILIACHLLHFQRPKYVFGCFPTLACPLADVVRAERAIPYRELCTTPKIHPISYDRERWCVLQHFYQVSWMMVIGILIHRTSIVSFFRMHKSIVTIILTKRKPSILQLCLTLEDPIQLAAQLMSGTLT